MFFLNLKKITVKPVLSYHPKRRPKLVFKTDYRLMQVKSIAECSKGSTLQHFWPSLSYHLSLRSLFCLFLSGHLWQVFLYIARLIKGLLLWVQFLTCMVDVLKFWTLVVCQNRIDKQCRPRSDCFWSGSSQFAILTGILWIPELTTNILFWGQKRNLFKF